MQDRFHLRVRYQRVSSADDRQERDGNMHEPLRSGVPSHAAKGPQRVDETEADVIGDRDARQRGRLTQAIARELRKTPPEWPIVAAACRRYEDCALGAIRMLVGKLGGDETPGRVAEDDRARDADGVEIAGQRLGLLGDTERSAWLLTVPMSRQIRHVCWVVSRESSRGRFQIAAGDGEA